MDEMDYLVYDGNALVAGFIRLVSAVTFCEVWRWDDAFNPMTIVNAETGEVIDTWVNGAWEGGKF